MTTSNTLCNESEHEGTLISKYDTYACLECDKWMEKKCNDKDCEFCAKRPSKPSDT